MARILFTCKEYSYWRADTGGYLGVERVKRGDLRLTVNRRATLRAFDCEFHWEVVSILTGDYENRMNFSNAETTN